MRAAHRAAQVGPAPVVAYGPQPAGAPQRAGEAQVGHEPAGLVELGVACRRRSPCAAAPRAGCSAPRAPGPSSRPRSAGVGGVGLSVGVEQQGELLARRGRAPVPVRRATPAARRRRRPGRRAGCPRGGARAWPGPPSTPTASVRRPTAPSASAKVDRRCRPARRARPGAARGRRRRPASRCEPGRCGRDVRRHRSTAWRTSSPMPWARTRSWSSRYLRTVPSVAATEASSSSSRPSVASAWAQSMVSATPGGLYRPRSRTAWVAAATWRASASPDLRRPQPHDGDLAVEVGVLDPVVEAAALQGVVDVAGAVRRDDHDRGHLGPERPELGDRDRVVGEDLEQERLELVVGPVDLVDEQHRRRPVAASWAMASSSGRRTRNRSEYSSSSMASASAPRSDRRPRPPAGAAAGGSSPTRRRPGRRRCPRSTAAGRAAAGPAGQHLGHLGLADAGLALEQQRPPQPQRQEDRRGQTLVGQVVVVGEGRRAARRRCRPPEVAIRSAYGGGRRHVRSSAGGGPVRLAGPLACAVAWPDAARLRPPPRRVGRHRRRGHLPLDDRPAVLRGGGAGAAPRPRSGSPAHTFGRTPRVHIEADFRTSLRRNDVAEVDLSVVRIGRTSLVYRFVVSR